MSRVYGCPLDGRFRANWTEHDRDAAFHQIDAGDGEIPQASTAACDDILQCFRRPTKLDCGAGLAIGDTDGSKLRAVESL
jgi:hypothetical protein